MNNLSIEELKRLRALCNGNVFSAVLDELIAIRELKGDQVPFRYMAEWSSQYGGMEYDYSEVRSEMDEVAAEHDGSVIELFTAPQKPVVDYFSSLVESGKLAAEKAMSKHPQPNYVLLKVAEEAGEVVQAGVHYAEGRMTWEDLEGEVIQLIAMLNRLMVEGDQVNGVRPPQEIEAAGGKVITDEK